MRLKAETASALPESYRCEAYQSKSFFVRGENDQLPSMKPVREVECSNTTLPSHAQCKHIACIIEAGAIIDLIPYLTEQISV